MVPKHQRMTAASTRSPRLRRLTWLPAFALIAWGVLAAAGIPLERDARAASSGSTAVTASVLLEIHIGGTCPGGSLSGVSMSGSAGATLLGSCTVTFGTNNGTTGSVLKVEHPRPSGNVAFCQATELLACSGGSFTDETAAGSTALADGAFGVQVAAAPTCSTPTWTNGNYYGIRDATTAPGVGDTVCTQAGTTDGSYSLDFEANPVASTTSGTYYTRADFTVEAS